MSDKKEITLLHSCSIQSSVTRTRNSEVRHKILNIGWSSVIKFYIIHFIDKVCWTSQILGENSWKNVTFFCYDLCFRGRRRGADDQCIKTNKKMSHFFKNFLQGFVRFSKLFHWFHVAKCYSELKNEELSWKKLILKLFRKLS